MVIKNCSVDTTIMGGAVEVQFGGRKNFVDIVGPNSTIFWMALDSFLNRKNFGTVKLFSIFGFILIIVLIIY